MFGRMIRNLALAMACTALLPAAALAQAAPSAQSAKPDKAYFDLHDAMISGMDLAAMTDTAADAVFDGLVRNDPTFAEMAKGKPELRNEFRAVARPFMRVWLERATTVRRNQIARKLTVNLTPSEARELADFYGSPLGKKVMLAITRNLSLDASVDTVFAGKSASSDRAARTTDEDRTANNAMQKLLPTLSPEEQTQILKFGKTKAFGKLPVVSSAFSEVAEPTIEEITTPEERENFKQALTAFFTAAIKGR